MYTNVFNHLYRIPIYNLVFYWRHWTNAEIYIPVNFISYSFFQAGISTQICVDTWNMLRSRRNKATLIKDKYCYYLEIKNNYIQGCIIMTRDELKIKHTITHAKWSLRCGEMFTKLELDQLWLNSEYDPLWVPYLIQRLVNRFKSCT